MKTIQLQKDLMEQERYLLAKKIDWCVETCTNDNMMMTKTDRLELCRIFLYDTACVGGLMSFDELERSRIELASLQVGAVVA